MNEAPQPETWETTPSIVTLRIHRSDLKPNMTTTSRPTISYQDVTHPLNRNHKTMKKQNK